MQRIALVKTISRVWLTGILALTVCSFASAATYYVDATNGNDTRTGTSEAQAWKTLGRVTASRFNPGDTVLLKRGCTWRERFVVPSSGAEGSPFTIDAYGTGAKPLILASERGYTWTRIGTTNKWASSTINTSVGFMLLGPEVANPVLGVNVAFVANAETDVTTNGRFCYDSTNKRVILYTDNPGGPAAQWPFIEVGVRDRGLIIDNKSYVTVKNIDARYGSGGSFRICNNSHHIVLEGCDASYGGGTMTSIMGIRAGDIIKMDTGVYNITLRNCTSKYAWEAGISVEAWSGDNALHDIIIEDCELYGDGCGIALGCPYYEGNLNTEVYNIWIRRNKVGGMGSGWIPPNMTTHGTGMYCYLNDEGNSSMHDVYIEDNVVDGFTAAGIYMMNGEYTLRRNVIKNGSALFTADPYWNCGILAHGGGGSESKGDVTGVFQDNIIANNVSRGILVINNTPTTALKVNNNTFYASGNASTYPSVEILNSSGVEFKNNIVYATNAIYAFCVPASGYTADYNCFYKASGPMIKWSWATGDRAAFANYQSASKQDARSMAVDPKLNADFTLATGSPCLAKAADGGNIGARVQAVPPADTIKPVITMLGTSPVTIQVGSTYADAGATATDNVDGDVTARIVTANAVNAAVAGSYTVRYNVADAAGNAAVEVVRTVQVVANSKPVITMLGQAAVIIEVKANYMDAGATATDAEDGTLTSQIVVVNNVNTAAVGSYTVTYDVVDSKGLAADRVTRTVQVVDTTKPVLTLSGQATVTIEAGSTYTDAGATATDNYEGNITARIVVANTVNAAKPGSYTVTYNVSDSSGNAAAPVTRTVNVSDTTKPVITLNGSGTVTAEAKTAYTDAGVTASDNVDGDITARVVTNSTVNVNSIGTYTVTYTVSDSAGNAANQVVRTVKVVDTTKPVITPK